MPYKKPMMKLSCVSIWKFNDAPKGLRLLYNELGTPVWVALIPRGLGGRDLEDAMVRNPNTESVSRYNIPNGDVVYFGTPRIGQVSDVITDGAHPESTHLSST